MNTLKWCLIIASMGAIIGCQPQQEKTKPPKIKGIEETILSMKAQGYMIQHKHRVLNMDGSLHHLMVVAQKDESRPARFALFENGQLLSSEDANKQFWKTYRTKYGALNKSLALALEQNDPTEKHIAMWFNPKATDFDLFTQTIKTLDSNAIIRTQPPHIAFFKTDLDKLQRSGTAFMNAATKAYPLNRPRAYSCKDESVTTGGPQVSASSNSTFNANDIYGQGIKVGLVELFSPHEGIWDGHLSLFGVNGGNGPVYQNPPQDCNDYTDCSDSVVPMCRKNKAGDKKCVLEHGSLVASRIAATGPQGFNHAAKIDLYVANGELFRTALDNDDWSQVFDILVTRYNWLIEEQGVRLINESWGMTNAHQGQPFATFHDALNTWYTYHRGVTFVRAAGQNLEREEVDCHALNSICVGGLNEKCTYANINDDTLDGQASWRNPHNQYIANDIGFGSVTGGPNNVPAATLAPPSQIERPDIVAESVDLLVMDLYPNAPFVVDDVYATNVSPTQFTRRLLNGYPFSTQIEAKARGTSFAAPTITGMLAMCVEAAGATSLNPKQHKVYTRIAATIPQKLNGSAAAGGWFYPTYEISDFANPQQYEKDAYVGAGVIRADDYYSWCAGDYSTPDERGEDGRDGSDWDEGVTTIDLNNGDPLPPAIITQMPPVSHVTIDELDGLVLQGRALRTNNSNPVGHIINQYGDVKAGERIRVVAAYDACPTESINGISGDIYPNNTSNQPDMFPNFDLDLMLCDASVEPYECEVFSESANDSVEGFDIKVSKDYDNLTLFAFHQAGATSCFGNQSLSLYWSSVRWY